MSKLHNRIDTKKQRRALRADPTRAKHLLWGQLRGRRTGRKFRRQHGVGPYVVDFYCPAERLAVELDGTAHDSALADARDAARDAFLRRCRIRTLRFTNDDVETNLEGVIAAIVNAFARDAPV
jgi:very-short-patch-repair endonuclease